MKKQEKLLAAEIEIEFKAALYFYTIMFFYFGYQICNGHFAADILILIEMILATYAMGYVQVFLLQNFDESESFTWKEALKVAVCACVYVMVSWLGKWFERNLVVTLIYFAFMLLCYGCVYWLYRVRRIISTKEMNQELEAFKRQKNIAKEK